LSFTSLFQEVCVPIARRIAKSLIAAAVSTAVTTAVSTSVAQTQGVHPGFTLTNLRPSGFNPQVSGLDFLPDGRLVVSTWEGFSTTKANVYIVSNAQTGDASKVTFTKFAGNLYEPLGVKVVDGKIYVLQKDQLSLLPDANKDGVAETPEKIVSGWGIVPMTKSLEFAMGMLYKDSLFYGALATAYPFETKASAERGCVITMSLKTRTWENFACGTRTIDGMTWGPEGELFGTENQGNWVPTSKLLHFQKGHFYGVHKDVPGPFDKVPETPPAVWLEHSVIGISPTQPVYLTSGVYKGQMLAGDNNFGTLQRYFLEKVGNAYQGAVFRFSGGLDAGANRIIEGPDSAIYIGGIGTTGDTWGGWAWSGKLYGLQRMAPNGTSRFDLLAVRSLSATTMELEFTEPVGTGAEIAANYAIKHWTYVPERLYGAGKKAVTNLTVSSASLSADKKKVTLTIPGMLLKDVIYIKLSNVLSATGNLAPWSTETWYTLNAFGPASPPTTVGPSTALDRKQSTVHVRALAGGKVSLQVSSAGRFLLDIRDSQGRIVEHHAGTGPMEMVSQAEFGRGVYFMTLKNAAGVFHQRIVNP
jgi:hypothetical protein